MSEETRLDRLEALAENILIGLQETKAIANSNARAIEALTNQMQQEREEREKDRKGIYILLTQLTRSMSNFYETQSDFYSRFDEIDARQARMTEILRELKDDKDNTESQS